MKKNIQKDTQKNEDSFFLATNTPDNTQTHKFYLEDGANHQTPYNNMYYPNTANQKWIDYKTIDYLDYPKELLRLYQSNPMHGGIIDRKVGFAISIDGINYNNEKNEEAIKKVMRNPYKILHAITKDYLLYGGFCFLVTYSRDWSKQISVDWLDFSKVRAEEVDDNMNINNYYYAWDFEQVQIRNTKPIKYGVYNPNTAKNNAEKYRRLVSANDPESKEEFKNFLKTSRTQLYYYKEYNPDNFYYPVPSYIKCIDSILSVTASTKAGLSELKNGFTPSVHINMETADPKMTKDVQNTIKTLEKNYLGCSNNGKPFVTVTKRKALEKDGSTKPNIQIIPIDNKTSNFDKYLHIDENAKIGILQGHGINHPLLAGIQVSGKLGGGGEELKTAWKIYQKDVLRPIANTIQDETNYILSNIEGIEPISIEPQELFTDNEQEQ